MMIFDFRLLIFDLRQIRKQKSKVKDQKSKIELDNIAYDKSEKNDKFNFFLQNVKFP